MLPRHPFGSLFAAEALTPPDAESNTTNLLMCVSKGGGRRLRDGECTNGVLSSYDARCSYQQCTQGTVGL